MGLETLWSMLIKGYDYGPLVAGEWLLERSGFWSNHLLAMCRFTSGEIRPAPEWFGDDGADTDALAGLSWRDISHIADTPDLTAPGVHDTEARLLLLLPLLADDELPPEAPARANAALTAVGAPEDSAQDTADHLLRNRRPAASRRGGADSPLSGGSRRLTEPHSDPDPAVSDPLGRRGAR